MRSPPDLSPPSDENSPGNTLPLDEDFLQRVDRVMRERKQTDPFRLEAVWRATQEEARLRHLQLPKEDRTPIRSDPR
jgi:hypothetical protein